jgi:uncharacterized protein YjbI with pentapeptide repeats
MKRLRFDSLACLRCLDWPKQRQQCIDVLCAYPRMPAGIDLSEREVRATIVRTIRKHLRDDSAISWSKHDFDFTRAAFHDASFRRATFCGERTTFYKVTFSGKWTNFGDATFSGKYTGFDHATFSGEWTTFGDGTFSGGTRLTMQQ